MALVESRGNGDGRYRAVVLLFEHPVVVRNAGGQGVAILINKCPVLKFNFHTIRIRKSECTANSSIKTT